MKRPHRSSGDNRGLNRFSLTPTITFAVALVLWTGAVMQAQPRKGGGAAHPGAAGRAAAPQRPGPGAAKALERLSKMPPAQRERVMEKLPPERRDRVQRQLEEYNRMPPEERDRLHQQVEVFRQLPPERQDAARMAFRRFNNLPPERQAQVRDELQALRNMSPDERRARMNSDEFRSKFKRHEQEMVEELSDVMPQP